VSPRHNWCAVCERDFRTPAGLRIHVEYAAVHRDDSDDDSDDEEIDDSVEGWEDELGLARFPNEQHPFGGEIPDSDVDYWTDDDNEQFEEELDAYDGFAPVPSSLRSTESNDSPFSDEHISEHQKNEHHRCHDSERTDSLASAPSPAVLVSCPLCLEAPKATSATKCGHLFCTS
jgi:E3 ubiquitin-protein ligase RFWD3